MLIRAVGSRGKPMWIIFKFYKIIIKSARMDKVGGFKKLIHKNVDTKKCVFLYPRPKPP